MKVYEILDFLDNQNICYNFIGNNNINIEQFSPYKLIKDNSITFLREPELRYFEKINEYKNILVVTKPYECKYKINCIYVDNPHMIFFKILDHFYPKKQLPYIISKTAIVETEELGKNVSIGNHTFIDKNVLIGNNVIIGNNVSIIGDVTIGNNVFIDSGAVIGSEGFGHYIDNGINVHVPHFAGVYVGDNVYIGANTTIARGTLSDTIISDGVKIDNLCHIGHNVEIKKNVTVTAGTIIAGSTTVQEGTWIAPNTSIKNGLNIGSNSLLGVGAVVIQDVEENNVVIGNPAKFLRKNNPIK